MSIQTLQLPGQGLEVKKKWTRKMLQTVVKGVISPVLGFSFQLCAFKGKGGSGLYGGARVPHFLHFSAAFDCYVVWGIGMMKDFAESSQCIPAWIFIFPRMVCRALRGWNQIVICGNSGGHGGKHVLTFFILGPPFGMLDGRYVKE